MFKGQTLSMTALSDGLVELCFDREGDSVNKFDRATIAELRQAVALLQCAQGLRGVLITSAKSSFIVGADIYEFEELFGGGIERVEATIAAQAAMFDNLATLPVPTVVAINGTALGGGFELALTCDRRLIADSATVGLPEVMLGILPGYGGTVRLPRLIGCDAALRWMTTGAQQSAATALADGAVDEVLEAARVRDAALEWLREAAAAPRDWRERRAALRGAARIDADALAKARLVTGRTAHRYPAAAAAVQLLADAATLDAARAQALETRTFATLATTPTAASLVRLFKNEQHLKRLAKAYVRQARPVRQAAVLGAGIMGGGIAYTSALRGVPVAMKDITDTALATGMAEVDRLLARQVDAKRMTADQARQVRSCVRPQLNFDGFTDVDLLVEAIVEDLNIKKKVLAEIEDQLAEQAIIASNTSSLSIATMASVLKRQQNFVGMHFFNPVPQMPLVEVIRGPVTDPVATATAAAYAVRMGKTPIVVKDCPGFLVNRILIPYFIGFARLVGDGANFRRIDRVMEAFGWPMGPAYLADVIGMDTLSHVMDVIAGGYVGRMAAGTPGVPNIIAMLRADGRLGQKSGRGFYRYESDVNGKPCKLDDDAVDLIVQRAQMQPADEFTDEEIVDRLMLPMLLEAARCVDEDVAGDAVQVDMGVILGLGFPRHLGGILHWGDQLGWAEVVQRCDRLHGLGPLYRPSPELRQRAFTGASFHS